MLSESKIEPLKSPVKYHQWGHDSMGVIGEDWDIQETHEQPLHSDLKRELSCSRFWPRWPSSASSAGSCPSKLVTDCAQIIMSKRLMPIPRASSVAKISSRVRRLSP
jgi:hypothetical protein